MTALWQKKKKTSRQTTVRKTQKTLMTEQRTPQKNGGNFINSRRVSIYYSPFDIPFVEVLKWLSWTETPFVSTMSLIFYLVNLLAMQGTSKFQFKSL